VQVATHVHAVEHVIVVAGDHRSQPCGDRRLGKRPTALDRRDRRSSPVRNQDRNAPKFSNVTASQSSPNSSRNCHHNANARA